MQNLQVQCNATVYVNVLPLRHPLPPSWGFRGRPNLRVGFWLRADQFADQFGLVSSSSSSPSAPTIRFQFAMAYLARRALLHVGRQAWQPMPRATPRSAGTPCQRLSLSLSSWRHTRVKRESPAETSQRVGGGARGRQKELVRCRPAADVCLWWLAPPDPAVCPVHGPVSASVWSPLLLARSRPFRPLR